MLNILVHVWIVVINTLLLSRPVCNYVMESIFLLSAISVLFCVNETNTKMNLKHKKLEIQSILTKNGTEYKVCFITWTS